MAVQLNRAVQEYMLNLNGIKPMSYISIEPSQ